MEQHFQAVVKLHHTNAERGGDTKNSPDHGSDIHAMTDRAVNALTKNRVQRRTDGQRQVIAVAEIAQCNAHQRVHRPAGQAVVEQRPGHGLPRGFQRLPVAFRWQHVLCHRFGDREEHQVDADPGSKQHCSPAHHAEFGFGLFRAQFDRTKT